MSDQPSGSRFNTLAIHAGGRPDAADRGCPTRDAAAAPFDVADGDADALARRLVASGGSGLSPTSPQAVLEERVAALDGGSAALAVASGQMARLVVLHTLLQPGDELVASRQTAGGAPETFDRSLKSFGWHVKWADVEKPETFVEALSDKTKAVLIDSISALGRIADLEAIARVAKRARVPLVVDNSFATPILVRPFEFGADVVLYTATKLLCGPGARGGLIVDGGMFEWTNDSRYPAIAAPTANHGGLIIAEAFGNFAFAVGCRLLGDRDFGGALLPSDASSMLFGIETLPLRMRHHCDNALAVARFVQRHAAVSRVSYAGLASDRGYPLSQRFCPQGAGAMLTFELVGGRIANARLLDRLKLLSKTDEIGDTRSLATPITSGSGSTEIRISIGLEDTDDIISDLNQALAG